MTEFLVTFGVQYAYDRHPTRDDVHPDGVALITAADETAARRVAIATFDQAWSHIYANDDTFPWHHFPRGVIIRLPGGSA